MSNGRDTFERDHKRTQEGRKTHPGTSVNGVNMLEAEHLRTEVPNNRIDRRVAILGALVPLLEGVLKTLRDDKRLSVGTQWYTVELLLREAYGLMQDENGTP